MAANKGRKSEKRGQRGKGVHQWRCGGGSGEVKRNIMKARVGGAYPSSRSKGLQKAGAEGGRKVRCRGARVAERN